MPHHSGGGSHHGGHHSSHSHHSSGGGSHSGATTSGISRKWYPGATRYAYYPRGRRGGTPTYLYYRGKRTAAPTVVFRVIAIMMAISLIVTMIPVLMAIYRTPKKQDVSRYDSRIVLEDPHGMLSDPDAVTAAMESYRDTTGVTPAVQLLTDEDWQQEYYTLETCAYSEYLKHFNDEKHWLFVISYPADYVPGTDPNVDWKWEGMIGDELSATVSSSMEKKGTQLLQQALLRGGNDDLSGALVDFFGRLETETMKKRFYPEVLPVALVFIGTFGIVILAMALVARTNSRLNAAVPVAQDAVEGVCLTCRGKYVVGSVTVCPYCGTELPEVIVSGTEPEKGI